MDTTVGTVSEIINSMMSASQYANNVNRIGIFGSVARNSVRKSSDVDLVLDYRHDDSFDYFYFCNQLEEAIKKNFGRGVSILEESVIKDGYLDESVERELIWVYGKK